MSDETKRSISEGDYIKLVGLLTIADEHNRALDVIGRAVAGITGEEEDGAGYFGHSSDAVIGEHDARSLLCALGLSVERDGGAA